MQIQKSQRCDALSIINERAGTVKQPVQCRETGIAYMLDGHCVCWLHREREKRIAEVGFSRIERAAKLDKKRWADAQPH